MDTAQDTIAETRSAAGGPPRVARMRWHGPLMALAATMAVTGVISVVGLLLDDRELVGAPIWAKPFKFSVSVLIYAVTWAWLIGQLRRFRRTAWWAGTVISVSLFIEMGVVFTQTVRGERSHFNQQTPTDELLWSIMGITIAVLWLATLVAAILLWFSPDPDRARTLAVRLAAIICLGGLTLGFLMTMPTDQQIAAGGDIVGAHTVGAADGGAGIPILNWSTEHGDLRIPHFIGMHALQLIPLALILIEFASRRVPILRDVRVRAGLVWTAASAYAAVVALVTWQALRGQSIVQPDGWTVLAAGGILLAALAGTALSLSRARSETLRQHTPQ